MDQIETYFLCQGCQTVDDVAHHVANFISQATETLDMSVYSFSLCPEPRDILLAALHDRANAGVKIRIAYDAGTQQGVIPHMDNDICDLSTPTFVKSLGFPCEAIEGYRALMHDKYIVIDSMKPSAQVWTGSLNFSDDAWTLQENNVIILQSQPLAAYYAHDFADLWVDSNIASSNTMDSGEATLLYHGRPTPVLINFAPGEGMWIDQGIAQQIDRATRQVTLATVVLTSGGIIKALLGLMQRGVPMNGIYDWSQMEGVKYQWQMVPDNRWKIGAWEEIVQYGHLVGKASTPYTPTSKHDYMHNKVMVLDDTVITGSYNFSRHAQANAENVLYITSPDLADIYRQYISSIAKTYSNPNNQPVSPQVVEQQPVTPAPDSTR